jgi:DUF1680 family protein
MDDMDEKNGMTRRSALALMTVGLGAIMTRGGVFGATSGPATVPDDFVAGKGSTIEPFRMTEVRLLDGPFKQQAEFNQSYLASLDTNRLLHSFRLTAGITSTATSYGGWEKADCELRGHFNGGHYLSAVALAYASTGNDALRKNGDLMVAELAKCQKANGNGYLSAFPEAGFERLAAGGQYWAPFYTYHKIVAGMLDMYVHTGNEQALEVAEGMARWVRSYFKDISEDRRMYMLRTEYGGMNEVLANLAGLTGREQYLATAHLFEQPMFLDPLAAHRDELTGLHANTHVPKVIGAARMYELTAESRYRDIANYFLDEVLAERNYAIGNCSADEHWNSPAGDLKGTLQYHDAECCVAYNLMKLERHVFAWTGNTKYMDAYERALWNCRLGTQNPGGLKQYFFPLAAGYWRQYNSADGSFWCCTGTGAEEFAKFNDTIYFHDADSVWVNQFLPSEMEWKEKQFGLRQETSFPEQQGTTLIVKVSTPQRRTLCVRVPGWTAPGGSVQINGRELEAFAEPGSYLSLTREWRDGDKIEVSLPMQLTSEPLAGDPSTRAALYGPLVLAANIGPGPEGAPLRIGNDDPWAKAAHLPLAEPNPVVQGNGVGDWMEIASAKDLSFRSRGTNAFAVKPLCRITDEKYAVYWSTEEKG